MRTNRRSAKSAFPELGGACESFRQAVCDALPNAPAMGRNLCVFCGASAGNDESYARIAGDAARAIVRAGYGLVYGGGRIGLMGVLADAALAAGGEVIGVIPRALSTARSHTLGSRTARRGEHARAKSAHGGFEFGVRRAARRLRYDGRVLRDPYVAPARIHNKPIGLLNADGFFDRLIELFDEMTAKGFVSANRRELFTAASTMDELLANL